MNLRNDLTPQEKKIIIDKGTEAPFSGKYYNFTDEGAYTCKYCGTALFHSNSKFDSECGWPSFDYAIEGKVKRIPDADGKRTEILCRNCGAHLGHVFLGENFTPKNTRYCVNSISLEFVPIENIDTIIVAGGCFWGVEFHMEKIKGVLSAINGYTGGKTQNPSYRDVCDGNTGHFEAVEIVFDKTKVSCMDILKVFFEIHDFTQANGQGNDIGEQYESAIFYKNNEQKKIAQELLSKLKYPVTKLLERKKFYPAENYHQEYYMKNGKTPYCHFRKPINWDTPEYQKKD